MVKFARAASRVDGLENSDTDRLLDRSLLPCPKSCSAYEATTNSSKRAADIEIVGFAFNGRREKDARCLSVHHLNDDRDVTLAQTTD